MKKIMLFIVVLAVALTLSAWLGMEDARPAGPGQSRDERNNTSARTISARRGRTQNQPRHSDDAYQQALSRQSPYQATRSLIPAAKPLQSARTRQAAVSVHEEQGYSQFIRDNRGVRGTLVLQPLGDLPPDQKRALGHVLDAVSAFFGLPAVCASPIWTDALPGSFFRYYNGSSRLDAEATLATVLHKYVGNDIASIVGITEFELFLNGREFSHGLSSLRHGTAVITTAGLLDRTPADRGRNLLRLTKFIIHEMCHTFALKHCSTYSCLMNSCSEAWETDAAPLALCPDCLAKLSLATGRHPALHLEDMFGLCKAKGFNADGRFYLRSMQLVPSR